VPARYQRRGASSLPSVGADINQVIGRQSQADRNRAKGLWSRIRRAIKALRGPTSSVSLGADREQKIIDVAERMKRDLVMAIAAGHVLRPAASDNELIGCFNIGYASSAFDLMRHSLLFSQLMALMRLWDTTKNVHSIEELVRLLSDADLVAKLVERERHASHDTRQAETSLGERTQDLPFSADRETPDQREKALRAGVCSWVAKVKKAKGHAETARLRNYRHKILAHSATWSDRPPIPLPYCCPTMATSKSCLN
jgi:hypothetical protein